MNDEITRDPPITGKPTTGQPTPFVCLRWAQFGAWVAMQNEPHLSDKAFVVCERGYVVAASPPALEAGVVVGQTSGRASAHVAGLVIVSRDKSRETLAWSEIERQLYGLTPLLETNEVGLLFCALRPEKLARLLRMWSQGGTKGEGKVEGRGGTRSEGFWPVRAGSAGDRASAFLAATRAPNGVCRSVKSGCEASFAGKMPLSLLAGEIEPRTRQKLEWLGWKTLGQLRSLSRRQLEEQFGRDGLTLFRLARGAEFAPNVCRVSTWAPPPEVTGRISLELPARQPCEWNGALCEALLGATAQLGTRGAMTLQLTVQTPLGQVTARRVLREATSAPQSLLAPLQRALDTALQLLAPLPPMVVGFEVTLGGLVTPEAALGLFEDERQSRQNRLQSALQNLEARGASLTQFERGQSESPFEEDWWTSVSAFSGATKKVNAHAPFPAA